MKKLIKLITLSITLVVISLSVVLSLNNKESKVSATDIDNPTLSVYKKNLSYSSEIYIMYAVSYSGFNPETYPVKMLFYDTVQTEYTKDNATYGVATSGKIVVSDVSCLVYASKGLSAKQMTEDIYARAYVEIDDQIIYSEVVKYSVLEYTYEAMGKVNEKITNLLLAMKEYGSCAQINFDYLLDRLANATYYNVNVINGTLSDGFTQGRFQLTEEFTITANQPEFGYKFIGWTNSQGIVVSTDITYTTTVSNDETFTANYEEIVPVELYLSKQISYNSTKETIDLPETVSFTYDGIEKVEAVTWDTSTFVENQIGTQKIYGTLVSNQYVVKEISIEVEVLEYAFTTSSNECTITGYYGSDTEVVIPSTINNYNVVSIGYKAFASNTSLRKITIPSSVISIGTGAFYNCVMLNNIVIPNSVTSIEGFAFYSCMSLSGITIPSSVTTIGDGAFALCQRLGIFVDQNNQYFQSINGSLYTKDGKTLLHCQAYNVIISTNVTTIGAYAFYFNTNLTSIEIPTSVTRIENNAFVGCNLQNVYYIGTIEDWCNVIIDSNPMSGAEHFYLKKESSQWEELTEIIIPNTITEIGKRQFYGFKNVTSIEIPNSVTSIGDSAFYDCDSLTSIEIPNSVTSIESYAFSWCDSLTDVYYKGTIEEWNNIQILSGNDNLTNAEIHFKESIEIFEENGISYLYLGTYPQSLVDDSTIISNLNNISTTNNLGYIEYNGNEYKKVTASPYQSNYAFTNGQTIVSGNTYYFKVEPIKWRILESNDGTYKLLTDMLLDNTKFHTSLLTRTINETTIYVNNYEYSNIRAWLNGYNGTSYNVDNYTNKGFIDIAFTESEKVLINETIVDNSLSSTGNSSNIYICNNKTDKIYLLSYSEATNTNYGFGGSEAREAILTDYARSKGCYMSTDSSYYGNGEWWLRSPNDYNYGYGYNVRVVTYVGSIYEGLYDSDSAVRAALEITIK